MSFEMVESESPPAVVPKTRKKRVSAIAREMDAWQKGFDAGEDAHAGEGIFCAFIGAISGAALAMVVMTLLHWVHLS